MLWKWTVVAAICLLVYTGGAAKGKPVIKVSEKTITKEKIDSLVELLAAQQFPNKVLAKEEREYLKKIVAGNLLGQELLHMEAKTQKITADKSEIDSMFAVFRSGFPDEKTFQKTMQQLGDSEKVLREKIARQILIEKLLLKKLTPLARPDEAALKQYFQKHKDKFEKNQKMRASQIVLKLGKSPGVDEVEERRKQLEKWKTQIEGLPHLDHRVEAFAQAAYQFSEGPEAKEGGDLKPFEKGDFFPEFDKAIKSLKVGDVSDIFRTPLGLHIVMLTEKNDGTFENNRLKVMQVVVAEKAQKNQGILQEYFQTLAAKYKVDYLDPSYKGEMSAKLEGSELQK